MSSSGGHKPPRKSVGSHRSTLSMQRTEIKIHVYDLLPPGKLSSVLWAIGGSLLHSGVVIKDREYAYGGHDRPRVSGVYWTRPGLEPPGGTFRCEILQGFSFRSEDELQAIIIEASEKFQGTSYNLLTNNCNHFTSYLCERLTAKPAPAWLNRAASIGVALPCVVPREWIAPPDHDTAEGELVDEEADEDDERAAMLGNHEQRHPRLMSEDSTETWDDASDDMSTSGSSPKGKGRMSGDRPKLASVTDTSGREMPVSERAPMPKR
ncbi:DUF862-domain-containing protein [Saccharata proteae CBS 121410]|uniref:DUF862-domain-containing protein n=1 Tax=Saccharata proteae CBS 121410 TaxID=1314787 RepID=A0A9P4HRJ1_9PEZI|nr:DUF862-domain-containing protein [Saccharata proteae CBS 121410]